MLIYPVGKYIILNNENSNLRENGVNRRPTRRPCSRSRVLLHLTLLSHYSHRVSLTVRISRLHFLKNSMKKNNNNN